MWKIMMKKEIMKYERKKKNEMMKVMKWNVLVMKYEINDKYNNNDKQWKWWKYSM